MPACTSPAPSASASCGCPPTSTTRTGSRTASSTSSTTSATSPCRDPATGTSSACRRPGSTPARSTSSRPLWEMYIIEGLDAIEGVPQGCLRLRAQGPPRRRRRQVRRRDDHRDPHPDTRHRRSAATDRAVAARRPSRRRWRSTAGRRSTRCACPGGRCASPPASRPASDGPCGRCRPAGDRQADRDGARHPLQRTGHRPPRARRRGLPVRRAQADPRPRPGATVNDVALAIIGGALRELPERRTASCRQRRCGR